jgi:hypothetical protein
LNFEDCGGDPEHSDHLGMIPISEVLSRFIKWYNFNFLEQPLAIHKIGSVKAPRQHYCQYDAELRFQKHQQLLP